MQRKLRPRQPNKGKGKVQREEREGKAQREDVEKERRAQEQARGL